jgi:N-acetylglucosamine malate deacetylase 1
MKRSVFFCLFMSALLIFAASSSPAADKQLRIICFGAHPDDAEVMAGGVAALWTARGHAVKFVSTTNGDIGHWRDAGGPLALRRKAEVERAASILGNTVQVLDIHDGELEPTLENRRTIVRLIREWKADIVMTHRPNDYHPDHRYTAQLVQDAAYMVSVPFLCPDTPPLPWNPLFLFYSDNFQKPTPFSADIVVDIGPVLEKKLDALGGMESQFAEGGALGSADLMPPDPLKQAARRLQVRERFLGEFRDVADLYRKQAEEWVGKPAAEKIKYAEAFEICEYGRRPDKAEIRKLFPFFGP